MVTVQYNGEKPRNAFGKTMQPGDVREGLTEAEAAILTRNPEFEIVTDINPQVVKRIYKRLEKQEAVTPKTPAAKKKAAK